MKTLASILLVLLASIALKAQEAFELPTDNDTPVLTFDYSGGFRMRPPEGFVKLPQLQIFPNGRVLRSPNGPNMPSSEITLNEDQLNAFLEDVVNQHKFYEIEADAIRSAIEKSGKQVRIADAPSLDVSINLGQGTHEVSVYAVSFSARQFPDIEPLANLAAIEKTCRHLLAVTDLGGFENLEKSIEQVNEKLAKDHPEIPAMTVDNLQFASKNQGVTTASFNSTVEENGKTTTIRGTYTIKADGSQEVQINLYPQNK